MPAKKLADVMMIALGSLFVALGLVLFLVPNKIAAGGVSGLATVIFYLFHLPVGVTMLVLNIPLFLIGMRQAGISFGMKTFFGTVALSAILEALEPVVQPVTRDPLLASIYGGILVGVGLGLVFRAGGTTGGTDLAAQMVRRYLKFSTGTLLMLIDGLVIALAGLVFSLELALYALVSLYVSARVIDLVQEGVGYFKAALIISEHSRQIGQVVLHELNRGATALAGRGVYTDAEREVLLCVISRPEVTKLKELVTRVDPRALVIVTNVHEALGEGFKDIGGEVW